MAEEKKQKRLMMAAPLNCPYCDELAWPKPRAKRVFLDTVIYTKRQCIMGHEFWSEERAPTWQEDIEKRLHNIHRKKWNQYLKKYRSTPEYKNKQRQRKYNRDNAKKEIEMRRKERLRKRGTADEVSSVYEMSDKGFQEDVQKYDEGN